MKFGTIGEFNSVEFDFQFHELQIGEISFLVVSCICRNCFFFFWIFLVCHLIRNTSIAWSFHKIFRLNWLTLFFSFIPLWALVIHILVNVFLEILLERYLISWWWIFQKIVTSFSNDVMNFSNDCNEFFKRFLSTFCTLSCFFLSLGLSPQSLWLLITAFPLPNCFIFLIFLFFFSLSVGFHSPYGLWFLPQCFLSWLKDEDVFIGGRPTYMWQSRTS